jgi:proteasome beta subunit
MRPVQNTIFTPTIAPASEGADRLKTGTTTVGVICKDCVILAADKRATAGHFIADKKTQKVLTVAPRIGITTAGSVSDLQLLYKYLKAELKIKSMRSDTKEGTVGEAANLLAGWVYHLARSSWGMVHFLVGGYDTQPRLYEVYMDGSIMSQDDFIASGSGSVFALGVLENKYKKGLSREEGVKLTVQAINAALARDSASGNGIDVFIFDKTGARQVLSKEILTTTTDA